MQKENLVEVYRDPSKFSSAADELRNGIVGLFADGIPIQNRSLLGKKEKVERVPLKDVLGFSAYTVKHAQVLVQTLQDIEGQPIIPFSTSDEFLRIQQQLRDEDILYSTYSNEYNEPALWIRPDSALESRLRSLSFNEKDFNSYIAIGYRNWKDSGVWTLTYNYSSGNVGSWDADAKKIEASMKHVIGGYASEYPFVMNRRHLLQFYLSKKPLDSDVEFWGESFKQLQAKDVDLKKISVVPEKNGLFNTVDFHVDVDAIYADMNAAIDASVSSSFTDRRGLAADLFLKYKPVLKHFQVVELGTIMVNGANYFVYSGAEQPMAKEDVKQNQRGNVWSFGKFSFGGNKG